MLKYSKPTTPGLRGHVDVDRSHLSKERPHRKLTVSNHRARGRNNTGRITCRHLGGGSKKLYRIIDFKRDLRDVEGTVLRIEYDPNRTAHIALVCYADGERRYIIAPKGLASGMQIVASSDAPIKVGNTLPIRNIPVGTTIHCIELNPGKGAQLARSAGGSAQLLGRDGLYAQLRLRSGEIRKVLIECKATIGEVGNADHSLREYGKAGAKRWLGIRPTVRGVAMNPVDHPHGGGEGKTAAGRHPCSPWGLHTKGKKTRNNKRTDHLIIRDRRRK